MLRSKISELEAFECVLECAAAILTSRAACQHVFVARPHMSHEELEVPFSLRTSVFAPFEPVYDGIERN